ncbi:hypothetical protein C8J57DRAFT_1065852 [Mycena rebaudengoi]|nr:hypothetical protein C8J57DRAFT_1065852 [Mycena rebaudengoi]
MSTAQDTVISTPELLELALSHLPMRDLLINAPLVCKMWQEITLAPSLQRALFFQADPISEPVQNPLLVEMFPPFFAPEGPDRWSWPGEADTIMSMPWSKAPEAFKRREANWRRMLISQPPMRTMVITETSHGRRCNFKRQGGLQDLSLRMGVLHDLAIPFIDRIASSFCVRWHSEIDREVDLTLAVIFTSQCVRRPSTLGPEFYSDGAKCVDVAFGEWEEYPYD